MATQFEVLREQLDRIEGKLNQIMDQLGHDLDLSDEVPDIVPRTVTGNQPVPTATRTHAPVRKGSETEMVPWNRIDERVIEAVRIAAEDGEPWELYFGTDGSVRISTSEAVAHRVRKARTFQQPVPEVADREIDAFGEDA